MIEFPINTQYLGSFINICFGINTLAAVYRRLFLFFQRFYIRTIPTIEYTIEAEDYEYKGLTKLIRKWNSTLSKSHERLQTFFYTLGRTLSSIGAIFCLIMHISLIMNNGNFLGDNIVFLISPIFIYLALSLECFLLFVLPLLPLNAVYIVVIKQIRKASKDLEETDSGPT